MHIILIMTPTLNTTPPRSPASSQPSSLKRKRVGPATQPLTPPSTANDPEGSRLFSRAVNVLSTAATALSQVSLLYQSDDVARDGLLRAVQAITKANEAGGKLIICGVGKSGLVGRKIEATMKSLGIASSFMHAAEALHGDLGDIRQNDAVLFISYSGKTGELMALLNHIPSHTPILAITSQTKPSDCQLLEDRPNAILLPAPIHELEEVSFGVCAPTTSTTVTIAVGDMLALTVAEALHQEDTKDVFRRNHPGGAIGAKSRRIDKEQTNTDAKECSGLITPPAV
ncbi:Sugar isomerase KpsF/GutQ [Pyrenophora teres f. maculata]|nr:Sugar isomerase KpsF/GutQ [Pyrenophora teres f. maculata]